MCIRPLAEAFSTLREEAARGECCWKPADRHFPDRATDPPKLTGFPLAIDPPKVSKTVENVQNFRKYTKSYKMYNWEGGVLEPDRAIDPPKPI